MCLDQWLFGEYEARSINAIREPEALSLRTRLNSRPHLGTNKGYGADWAPLQSFQVVGHGLAYLT